VQIVAKSRPHKLIGRNYSTPDLYAKVTGTAKYAEDFRAEGMLFCKLLLSPMPHARVRRIDARDALAMPGVKAILTADDLPPPADSLTDNGTVIPANKWAERALTMEPLYQGEPILAVAAVDELTAAEAIEKIRIDLEPLPFAVDPLDTLRPGGPNPRTDGNVWVQPPKPPATTAGAAQQGPLPPVVSELKWTETDFAEAKQGRLPMGKTSDDWSFGDLDVGFKSAALVLDETFVTPDTSHQTLEPRSTMAYWQNGKVYVHTGTQSTNRTQLAIARWLNIDSEKVVFISAYTGGGFGSKITGGISLLIPVLLGKKANAPVMMRISREEETFIGRARPGFQGRMKVGFSKDGRITALDMFVVSDNGPYDAQGDALTSGHMVSLLYQPQAMRWRGVTALTNTPPRSAQSSPGGLQGIVIIETIIAKAARKLGLDQVAIRRINCPEGKALFGPPMNGKLQHATSAFIKEALDRGAEEFHWQERMARPKRSGTKLRGVGVSLSCYVGGTIGFDGLFVITPEGRLRFQSGIGNLGTESMIDVHRVAAELLDVPWEKCEVVWGDTSKHFPYTCVSGGSQTTHAMTRASHAAAMDAKRKLQEIGAKTLGGKAQDYEVANERVFRKGNGPSLTLAQAARRAIELGGIYDGHQAPADVNPVTKASVTALAGQGLVAVARDNYPRDGATHSYVATFAEVEVDVETGKYNILDFLAYADAGTIIHPQAFGGQVLGRSILGIGHAIGQKWVFDPHYGIMVSKRFHHNKPPTILDVPSKMQWRALDIADPETPVGARGIGEPPVAGGCASILNALSDALGDEVFQRAPVNPDTILASLEAGRPVQHPLMAHI
jgi:CO/xanthine dehydrogenase Mo-binding subunit